jgi:hypothetical protein
LRRQRGRGSHETKIKCAKENAAPEKSFLLFGESTQQRRAAKPLPIEAANTGRTTGEGDPAEPKRREEAPMTKIYALGFAVLFAVAATAAPAVAKSKHHGHHGHHGNHGHHGHHGNGFGIGFGNGIVLDFAAPVVYDEPDPIYCVGKHGKLYVCGWN